MLRHFERLRVIIEYPSKKKIRDRGRLIRP
jgi:hypothetical protein